MKLQVSELPPPQTFEPQGDPAQAVLLFFVVALPFGYWWYITVPEARLALAKDKRLQDGDTNQVCHDGIHPPGLCHNAPLKDRTVLASRVRDSS